MRTLTDEERKRLENILWIFPVMVAVAFFLGIGLAGDDINPQTLEYYPEMERQGKIFFYVVSGIGFLVSTCGAYMLLKKTVESRFQAMAMAILTVILMPIIKAIKAPGWKKGW